MWKCTFLDVERGDPLIFNEVVGREIFMSALERGLDTFDSQGLKMVQEDVGIRLYSICPMMTRI